MVVCVKQPPPLPDNPAVTNMYVSMDYRVTLDEMSWYGKVIISSTLNRDSEEEHYNICWPLDL